MKLLLRKSFRFTLQWAFFYLFLPLSMPLLFIVAKCIVPVDRKQNPWGTPLRKLVTEVPLFLQYL